MTNQTIPPCPVCGKVPEINEEKIYCNCPHNCGEYKTRIDVVQTCDCEHFCYPIYPANAGNSLYTWVDTVETLLGRACRELGVETMEQLKAKVQPDPRVAVLDRLGLLTLDQIEAVLVCAKAAVRASKTEGGIIITEDVTAVIDSIIAAQRGEVAND